MYVIIVDVDMTQLHMRLEEFVTDIILNNLIH